MLAGSTMKCGATRVVWLFGCLAGCVRFIGLVGFVCLVWFVCFNLVVLFHFVGCSFNLVRLFGCLVG